MTGRSSRARAAALGAADAGSIPAAPTPLHVVVPGPPCAQGRGRAVRMPFGIRVIDPAKSRSWKGAAQIHMQQAMRGGAPLAGPLSVTILAVFACPTTDHRKRDPRGQRWHAKAGGDADNIGKACLDAATGVLWIDDRQVSRLVVEKIIGAQGEAPRVEIFVSELAERA